jgi:hypothetical protein
VRSSQSRNWKELSVPARHWCFKLPLTQDEN